MKNQPAPQRSARVLLAASLIVFVLGRLAPGDPVALILAEQQSRPDVVERIKAEFGLDRPIPVQFANFVAAV